MVAIFSEEPGQLFVLVDSVLQFVAKMIREKMSKLCLEGNFCQKKIAKVETRSTCRFGQLRPATFVYGPCFQLRQAC